MGPTISEVHRMVLFFCCCCASASHVTLQAQYLWESWPSSSLAVSSLLCDSQIQCSSVCMFKCLFMFVSFCLYQVCVHGGRAVWETRTLYYLCCTDIDLLLSILLHPVFSMCSHAYFPSPHVFGTERRGHLCPCLC